MKRTSVLHHILRVLLIIAVLAAVILCVISPVPMASADSLQDAVPAWEPVELEAVFPVKLDYDSPAPYKPHRDAYLPNAAGYLDESLSVQISSFRWFDTKIQVAYVTVSDPSQLRAASYQKFPSKKDIDATKLAKREKAVLACNGDFIVMINCGLSVRNGTVLRDRCDDADAHDYDVLCIDDQGKLTIIRNVSSDKVTAYRADHTLIHAFTFGPGLVVDGELITEFNSRFKPTHRTQRMGIGQMPDGSYVIICCEGPDDEGSAGLTLYEFAQVFDAVGAVNAYNLDGGSSSWLVLDYKRINGPYASNHRPIADILYFVTSVPGGDD